MRSSGEKMEAKGKVGDNLVRKKVLIKKFLLKIPRTGNGPQSISPRIPK